MRKELVYNSNLGFRATYFAYNFISFQSKTMIFRIQQSVYLGDKMEQDVLKIRKTWHHIAQIENTRCDFF